MKNNWNIEAHVLAMDIAPPIVTNLTPIKPKITKIKKLVKSNT